MTIGVIDTGVDIKHKRLVNAKIDAISILESKSGDKIFCTNIIDTKGHGTGVVSIILKHIPDATIKLVKIDSEKGKIGEDLIVSGISYLLNKCDCNIINISMGIRTNKPSSELKKICQKAEDNDVVIVAASYYDYKELCYPAHFNSVISVGNGVVRQKIDFKWLEGKLTNVLAKGGFQRVAFPGNQFRFSSGTSLATAHFTGIIGNGFFQNIWKNKKTLIEWIKTNSEPSIFSLTKHDFSLINKNVVEKISPKKLYNKLRPSPNCKDISIFPFEEKEMKSLIQCSDNLTYKLKLAIGYPRTLKLNNVIELLNEKKIPFTTKSLTDEDFNKFDTIVIGYFLDKQSDHNTFFGYSLLKSCLERNKNIIIWDQGVRNLIETIIIDSRIDYCGEIYLTSFDNTNKDVLYASVDQSNIDTPSICVVGTNSRQGKFTTQMKLKNILKSKGNYDVAHLATEPQGILLGADFTFPIGHNGTIDIKYSEWGKSMRLLINLIEQIKEPDIIISGSQGGITPLHPIDDLSIPEKLVFVKSFYPDAIICTISPNDTIDNIKNTINILKAYVKTEVLFYALTPWQYIFHHGNRSLVSFKKLENHEYLKRLDYYNSNLDKPVYDILNKVNDSKILNIIQNYF